MDNIYRLGELFCGAGGLALGAKVSINDAKGNTYSYSHEWANDLDEWACRTYRRNIMPNKPDRVICGRVQDLDIEGLPSIDGLLFGFPCNDYSIVGEQRGIKGEFGPLYSYGIKVIKYHKPLFFLAENVSGLSSADDGRTFSKILDELETAGGGYNITPHLYKFEEYGVPQTRHRIIIVGFKKSLGINFKVPAPTHSDRYITCFEALQGVDEVPYNNERTKHSRTTIERLSYIPQGGNAWHPGIPDHLKLNVKGLKMSNIYRRLHKDYPSYTLTGSGGGGTHVYHWSENRALTNRERARLQTFPDDFVFEGSKESVRAQIGHAVPPRGASVIFEAILKCLAGIEYDFVPARWEDEVSSFENRAS